MIVLAVTLCLASTGALSSVLCPARFDPSATVHIPHPMSCGKYLTCVGSSPVEQDCPAGLHWNEATTRCDYPGAAGCSRAADSEGRNFNATRVAASMCLPQTQRCPLNSRPTEEVVFLKHRDCRKFYACVSAQAVELSCPPGLYWNSRSCVCDYAVDDDCDEEVRNDDAVPEEPQPESEENASHDGHEPQDQDHEEPQDQDHEEPQDHEIEPQDEQPQHQPEDEPENHASGDVAQDAGQEPEPEQAPEDADEQQEPQPESNMGRDAERISILLAQPEHRLARRSAQFRDTATTTEAVVTTTHASGADVHKVSSILVLIVTFIMSVY